MKKIALLICVLSTAFAGKGQNLVPNGDFEQYNNCPTWLTQIDTALFWFNPMVWPPGGSPEYLNECATGTQVGVPDNAFGYQYAHSGAGYAGLCVYNGSNTNFREYIEVQLTSPLVAGCYYFEMYVSSADNLSQTSDDFGIYFSDTIINGITNYDPFPFTPQLTNPQTVFPDTANWLLVSGNYTAAGGENFLVIGNFKYDNATSLVFQNQNGGVAGAYIFVDDVLLTPCTGIEEQNTNGEIKIYPNPVKDQLTIQHAGLKIKEIKIFDAIGKKVFEETDLKTETINLQSFKKGIYFVEINDGKKVFRKKFIKK